MNPISSIYYPTLHNRCDCPSWQGDRRQVRLGYTAASLRHKFADLGVMAVMLDESLHDWYRQLLGRSIEEGCDHLAQIGGFVDNLLDEARELMDILG